VREQPRPEAEQDEQHHLDDVGDEEPGRALHREQLHKRLRELSQSLCPLGGDDDQQHERGEENHAPDEGGLHEGEEMSHRRPTDFAHARQQFNRTPSAFMVDRALSFVD
jgi:hypothetical protein